MNRTKLTSRISGLTALVILSALAASCGSSDTTSTTATTAATQTTTATTAAGDVTVSHVWARPALAGGNTAIYLTIRGGTTADELTAVTAGPDFAESVDLHETVAVDDHDEPQPSDHGHGDGSSPGPTMRTMRPVTSIAVPAGGVVELAPGGLHVMVMGLKKQLSVGDRFPATLTFANAGAEKVTVVVKES